ncbi:S1C family serine protease [Deinococcus sonorensis]|uniref:S1C family serine protease n=2 Tax=Deinococcus sonorensis TaxID=309891 RepID=A0AAU7UBW9_9DEIO
MRRSPWPVILLLVALAAYLSPRDAHSPVQFPFGVQPAPSLTDPLPQDARSLFNRVRPASVRIEQLSADGSGGLGSGFFISSGGLLLTAYHVVDGAKTILVRTVSNQTFSARVVGFDNAADVALLQIGTRGTVPYLNLAPGSPQVGESVLAVGNSGGDFLQPRRGRLLRLGAQAGRVDFPQRTLEMNAPLAPGDSGGPIINEQGQAIGVVSYIRVDDQNRTITSYAVPVSAGEQLITELRAGVKRDVPAIGLYFQPDAQGAGAVSGGVVASVVPGGPAARAGLQAAQTAQDGTLKRHGDVVVAVDGVRTRSADDVMFEIRRRHIGDTVQLTVSRGGDERPVQLQLVAKGTLVYRQ